jgi:hypothetical protein
MVSTYTTNKRLEKPGNGDYTDTWNVPVNADMDVIDQALGGTTALNATGGSATLTYTQYRSLQLAITGAISAAVTYTIPSGIGGQWILKNSTTDASGGPWTVTLASGGGGTSVALPRNVAITLYSDGTNIAYSSLPPDGSITTAKLADGAVTYVKMNSAALATGADINASNASKIVLVTAIWDSAAYVTATYAATVTLDFSTGYNFSITLTGNMALANPTNAKVGQSGIIYLQQDATGGRTLTYGSSWKFAYGTAPVLDTVANRVNILSYSVVAPNFILVSAFAGVR